MNWPLFGVGIASNMEMAGSARPTLLPVTTDRPKANAQNQKPKTKN
jgi:hypothetical protein